MLLALWRTPRVRVFVGFLLGYIGVQVLAAAAVQLVGEVDDAHAAGYAQARAELLPELAGGSPVDEHQDDAVTLARQDVDATAPRLADLD